MITMFAIALTTAATPAAPAAAPSQPAPAASPVTAARRYCVATTPTGSRIEQRVCRTRAEWLQQGFDPLERN